VSRPSRVVMRLCVRERSVMLVSFSRPRISVIWLKLRSSHVRLVRWPRFSISVMTLLSSCSLVILSSTVRFSIFLQAGRGGGAGVTGGGSRPAGSTPHRLGGRRGPEGAEGVLWAHLMLQKLRDRLWMSANFIVRFFSSFFSAIPPTCARDGGTARRRASAPGAGLRAPRGAGRCRALLPGDGRGQTPFQRPGGESSGNWSHSDMKRG